ncbi:hypothetical protein [Trujillonella humicola]
MDGDDVADVHRPQWNGAHLSDHAACTAEIRLAAPLAEERAGLG